MTVQSQLQKDIYYVLKGPSRLILILLSQIYPAFANSVDPDQLAYEMDLHCLPFVNLYQQP